jgi:hypothetical protein
LFVRGNGDVHPHLVICAIEKAASEDLETELSLNGVPHVKEICLLENVQCDEEENVLLIFGRESVREYWVARYDRRAQDFKGGEHVTRGLTKKSRGEVI